MPARIALRLKQLACIRGRERCIGWMENIVSGKSSRRKKILFRRPAGRGTLLVRQTLPTQFRGAGVAKFVRITSNSWVYRELSRVQRPNDWLPLAEDRLRLFVADMLHGIRNADARILLHVDIEVLDGRRNVHLRAITNR